jgi:uncharacterized protein (DUF362 family)
MDRSIVAITKGNDAEKMVGEALSHLGGVSSLIKPNSTVVVKPNAGHAFPPGTSVNTSPEMVGAVIRNIRKANPKQIILAEAASIGSDTMECLKVSGIGKAAEEAGVDKIIDVKREKDLIRIPIRDAISDLPLVLLPRFLIEADHIVNVPIFKSHVSMVFSCALKNIKGVVQDKVHHQMHQTNLAAAVMDLWSVVRADLTIADMIRPGEGFGPHSTSPVDFGCVVAGKHPVAVDATICRMVGLDVAGVSYFDAARERMMGNDDEKNIEIRGENIADVFKKLWLPYLAGLDTWTEYKFYAKGACSSCQGLLAYTMEMLKAKGEYDKNAGMALVVGRKKELPKGLRSGRNCIFIGDCLKKFRGEGLFAGGCPPAEPFILYTIMDRKDYATAEQGEAARHRYEDDVRIFQKYVDEKQKKFGADAGGKKHLKRKS